MRLLSLCCAFGVFLPAAAMADDCAVVLGAYTKLADISTVRQTARMANGSTLEMIAVGDDLYLSGPTGWKKMPGGGAERRKTMTAALSEKEKPTNCRALGAEVIDGVATTEYAYTPPPSPNAPSGEQQVWIGDADGLPHRMRAAAPGGQAMEMVLTYEGVTAPAQ